MAYRNSTIAKPSRFARESVSANVRPDIYAEVTDKIIRQLEAGTVPWVCPWAKGSVPISMPRNHASKRPYSGVNVLLLWMAIQDNGFTSSEWLTYKQAETIGANVRKGSKGTRVVYADSFVPKNERERAEREGDDAHARFFLKGFTVFNLDQLDGIERADLPALKGERETIEAGEALIKASGADFRIMGNAAFYVPSEDYIQVPDQRSFPDQVNFYRTACHELTHWTGAESRLNRKLLNSFGSKDYAREELVAEMGAAFVCASLGISPTVRHADYLGSWLQVLREDNRAIFRAAGMATKAAEYLLSRLP